jgi:hypothetical protein
MNYDVEIIGAWEDIDPINDNVDVIIRMEDGRGFIATFFTPANVVTLMSRHALSGEYSNGVYFWSSDMIFIKSLTLPSIRQCVDDMLQNGYFYNAFRSCE